MHFWEDEQASAMVEFAITMPLLVMTFLSAVSLAVVLIQNLAIIDAAAQAAKYGANGHNSDTAGMQNVAAKSATGISNFAVTASQYCACTPGGATVSCTSTCSPYSTPFEYVTVSTSASVPVPYGVPGISGNIPLSASSTLRVPWAGY